MPSKYERTTDRVYTSKTGRPTKFTEKLAEEICYRVANGELVIEICNDDDMPTAGTVYAWVTTNANFSDMFARARLESGHVHNELSHNVVVHADLPKDNYGKIDAAYVQYLRLLSGSHARLAGKLNKKYNDRLQQQNDSSQECLGVQIDNEI